MKIAYMILSAFLGLLNFSGLAFASASAVIKCPEFYKELYHESEILEKFQKALEVGNGV